MDFFRFGTSLTFNHTHTHTHKKAPPFTTTHKQPSAPLLATCQVFFQQPKHVTSCILPSPQNATSWQQTKHFSNTKVAMYLLHLTTLVSEFLGRSNAIYTVHIPIFHASLHNFLHYKPHAHTSVSSLQDFIFRWAVQSVRLHTT